jgi:pimeloyl-ACP methyl ester carboxylesterase
MNRGAPRALLPVVVAVLLTTPAIALAAPCANEDFETTVSGQDECLLMRRYGSAEPATMLVWLHGNVSTGGPANSHFRVAQKAATELGPERVLSVALVRPGYPDGSGAHSSGSDNGRIDNWTQSVVAEVGAVIARLKDRFRPRAVILVGHSGGAAIAASLLGMKPDLATAAILIGCPCDMLAWRVGRRGPQWSSEDPMRWVASVPARTRVIALTGSRDDTTRPALAADYVARLNARGIDAEFRLVADAGHIDILGSPAITAAAAELIRH